MRRVDIAVRAIRGLRQARARTILTSLAIAVGATTICLALAAGNGGRNYLRDLVRDSGDETQLRVTKASESSQSQEPQKIGGETTYSVILTDEDRDKIAAVDGVESVVPTVTLAYDSFDGVDGKYRVTIFVQESKQNEEFLGGIEKDYQLAVGEVAISENSLETLGFTGIEDAIGKTVVVNFPKSVVESESENIAKEFSVVAVIAADSDDYPYFLISYEDGTEIAKEQGAMVEGEYWTLLVQVKDGYDVKLVEARVAALGGYDVYSMMDYEEQLFEAVNVAQWGLVGFGALALLASIFGIINTQYISVLERTRQIGLMKALGCRRRDIARLFRYEAAWLGVLGGLIGVTVAWAVTLLNPMIAEFLGLPEETKMLVIDWLQAGVLVLGLMVIAILSGYFPARKAAKMDPIEALRTE